MSARARNNVQVTGVPGARTILYAHGFGCDQQMWRFVAPSFESQYQVVMFDFVGFGLSDRSSYDLRRYRTLSGYVADVLEIMDELNLVDVVFVGHSVSAMIGILAAVARPELFESLVLIGASPRYIDDVDYRGGFTASDIDELLSLLSANFLGWSQQMASLLVGDPSQGDAQGELARVFCGNDPDIARQMAEATFLADNRSDLSKCKTPALVLQMTSDNIAPLEVGQYVHANLVNSEFVVMAATGHCPNLSAPVETTAEIQAYLDRRSIARARRDFQTVKTEPG